ncbi:MAG: futalosine hydrolase [Chlamydiales bacterium]|jgi:futalosine hydrolase
MTRRPQPGAETLILIPTASEAQIIEAERLAGASSSPFALCGFGPIAAAASAARELARVGPERVLLIGIAGSFDTRAYPIGSATTFAHVAVDGIGAGEGASARTAAGLGFPQWPAQGDAADVFDILPLSSPGSEGAPTLLTVCSCSGSAQQAGRRRQTAHAPAAEDMEGFGVALACHQAGTPLTIVRGISNEVGDRDPSNWSIAPAMHAAWSAARAVMTSPDWSAPK